MPPSVRVTALHVYPLKSCAGTSLSVAEIGPRGIVHDREFMVVDKNGEFCTQRELPRLALIRPTLGAGGLSLSAPGMNRLDVRIVDGSRRRVRIWRDYVQASDQGAEVADWLSGFLHQACQLVRLPEDVVRPVDPQYGKPGDQVSLADGYPVLIISEESLADLNGRLAEPLPMNRFRPNIVVRGWGGPYGEDEWRTLRAGEVEFEAVKACARCSISTTNQETGERGLEPLRTLATYRQIARGVLFGNNLIPRSGGRVELGNELVIHDGAQNANSLV